MPLNLSVGKHLIYFILFYFILFILFNFVLRQMDTSPDTQMAKYGGFALDALKRTRTRDFPPSRQEIIAILVRYEPSEWMNEGMNEGMNEWMNEWRNEWINERMKEWRNDVWMNERKILLPNSLWTFTIIKENKIQTQLQIW